LVARVITQQEFRAQLLSAASDCSSQPRPLNWIETP